MADPQTRPARPARSARSARGTRGTRRAAAVVVALVTAAALASCGGDRDTAATGGGATTTLPPVPEAEWMDMTGRPEVVINTYDNAFEPRYVRVSPGTKLTFDNTGRNPHNVVPAEAGQFDTIPTDELQPGDRAGITFDDPGTYPYYCSLHGTASRGMTGRVQVVEG